MPVGGGGYARPRAVLSGIKTRLGRLGFRRNSAVSKVPRASSQERPVLAEAWISTDGNSNAQMPGGEGRGRATERSRGPAPAAFNGARCSESPTNLPGTVARSESMEVCVCRMRSRSPPPQHLISMAVGQESAALSSPVAETNGIGAAESPAVVSNIASLAPSSLQQEESTDPTEAVSLLSLPQCTSSPRWDNSVVWDNSDISLQTSSPARTLHATSPDVQSEEASPDFGGTFGLLSDGAGGLLSPLVFKATTTSSTASGETESPPSRRQSSVSEPGAELSPGASPPTTRSRRSSRRASSPYIDEAKSLFSEMLAPAQPQQFTQQAVAREILADMFNPSPRTQNKSAHKPCLDRPSYSPLLQPTVSKVGPGTPNFYQELRAIPNQKGPQFHVPQGSRGGGRKSREGSRLVPLNGRCKNFPPGDNLEGSGITPLRRPASVAGLRSVWQNTALGRIKILTPLLSPSEGMGSRQRSASVGAQTEAERSKDKAFEEWQESEIPLERSVQEAMQIIQDSPEFQRVTTKRIHVGPGSSGSFTVPHLDTTARTTIHLRGSRTLVRTEQPHSTTSPYSSSFPAWVMIDRILRGQACACDSIVDQSHEFVVHESHTDAYPQYCTVEC